MMKEDSESWFVASCITEEAMKSECAGREGCDHDGNHWMVLVGFTESEKAQFRSKEELLDFYVQIVVDTLNMSNAEAKERIYLVSVGNAYGFCVRLEGFALRNKLKQSENVMSTAHDCGWSRIDHASQSNMESKRKWSQKYSTFVGHVPMVADAVSVLPPKDHSTDSREEADQVREKLSRITLDEADRRRLIFEITGVKCYSSSGISPGLQGLENQQEVSSRSSRSPSVSSEDINKVDLLNGFVEGSGSASPASVVVVQHRSPDKIEPRSSRDLESYADNPMFRNDNSSYASLPHFAAEPYIPSHVENV